MDILAMIQARCASTRLPNKVLMEICGKTVLQWVIERVEKSIYIDETVVVTSINPENIPIIELCTKLGIRVGIGAEEDVLDRFFQTAKLIKPKYIVRITADCPLVDSEILDCAINSIDDSTDYYGNVNNPTFADGLDFEIIKYDALKKAWKESVSSFEREHVTPYIMNHPELFEIRDFFSGIEEFDKCRWTLDTIEDFWFIRIIFEHFIVEEGKEDFGYKDVMEFVKENQQLSLLNAIYSRNEGVKKSIEMDKIMTIDNEYY